jgi:hypothetical protein
MVQRGVGIEGARLEASKLLKRFAVESGQVNVEGLAAFLSVDLVDVKLRGATAQLVVVGERASIRLSDQLTDPSARRCAIAHELGHFVLGHASPPVEELCTPRPRRHFTDDPDDEDEANAFALELLTPERAVRALRRTRRMTLRPARQLASMCGVSVAASAIRITEASSRMCAAIFADRDGIRWGAPSLGFRQAFGVPAEGRPLDHRSLAWKCIATGAEAAGPELVPAAAWLDVPDEPPILEEVMRGSEPGTVLTMLWLPHREAARSRVPPASTAPPFSCCSKGR